MLEGEIGEREKILFSVIIHKRCNKAQLPEIYISNGVFRMFGDEE